MKYKFHYTMVYGADIEVEADNKDEAAEMALEIGEDLRMEEFEFEDDYIDLIKDDDGDDN